MNSDTVKRAEQLASVLGSQNPRMTIMAINQSAPPMVEARAGNATNASVTRR